MNILTFGSLPKKDLNGKEIYTSFLNMISFDIAMHDESLSDGEKLQIGIDLLYKNPEYTQEEADGLMWYFSCDTPNKNKSDDGDVEDEEENYLCDFEVDADAIYSSFLQAYGIRLSEVYMHWWEFVVLLYGLPDNTQMGYRIQYRALDLNQFGDKEEKKIYAAKKEEVSLERLRLLKLPPEERERVKKEQVMKKKEAWAKKIRKLQEGGGT